MTITVNPHARSESSQSFVFWFGEVAPLHLVVWDADFTDALDTAASYLAVHAPNHLMVEGGLEHLALLRQTAIELGFDPRHFDDCPIVAAVVDDYPDMNPFDDEPDEVTPPLGTLDASVRAEIEWGATGHMTQTRWGFLDADDWGLVAAAPAKAVES